MRYILGLLLFLTFSVSAQTEITTETRPLALKLAASNEGLWKGIQEPRGSMTSRGLFAYALVLCEANRNLERLEALFDRAAQMQDRDPQSKSYGNFKWKWEDEKIVDYNAVDFSMRGGSLLWIKHKEKIPPGAREKLRALLELSIEGLVRHRVREDYTNIAFMNAGDLILLGEALDKPKIADEGYRRLERAFLYTHEFGTHEYVSPTYYGPDLDALVMIEAYAGRERGVEQARALLQFFWTDIALNWFAPAGRLSGTHSRSYDYLSGLGELDRQLQLNGWLAGEPTNIDAIFSIQARWKPSDELKKLNEQYPRYVQQKWGIENGQWRANYIQKDVALSTSGASYGGKMDFPLTVDFPGPRQSVRCYFTSDARSDPYGKIKIAESATHSKALHLNPLWSAMQTKDKAFGMVTYRSTDVPPDSTQLQSHFVMPLENNGLWIDKKKIAFEKGKASAYPVNGGQTVFLRKGQAEIAVRLVASDAQKQSAPMNLVYDGNPWGAIRLSATHHGGDKIGENNKSIENCSASFFISVWPNKTDATLADFEQRERTGLEAKTGAPAAYQSLTGNEFSKVILAVNGDDRGRKILETVEPLKSAIHDDNVPVLQISKAKGVYFEAENAQIMPAFEIGEDTAASGGKFVWMPGEAGQGGGGGTASATWKLEAAQAGEYFLWGRVMAPTPDDDSFFVRTVTGGPSFLPTTTWSVGTHEKWEWVKFSQKLALPQGEMQLQLRVREDGAKMDRLFLTRDANEIPK